jgi:hypothetical protein
MCLHEAPNLCSARFGHRNLRSVRFGYHNLRSTRFGCHNLRSVRFGHRNLCSVQLRNHGFAPKLLTVSMGMSVVRAGGQKHSIFLCTSPNDCNPTLGLARFCPSQVEKQGENQRDQQFCDDSPPAILPPVETCVAECGRASVSVSSRERACNHLHTPRHHLRTNSKRTRTPRQECASRTHCLNAVMTCPLDIRRMSVTYRSNYPQKAYQTCDVICTCFMSLPAKRVHGNPTRARGSGSH